MIRVHSRHTQWMLLSHDILVPHWSSALQHVWDCIREKGPNTCFVKFLILRDALKIGLSIMEYEFAYARQL